MPDKRDKNGRFLPGNSGGGRPKTPDDVREALECATLKAVQKLISLIDSENEKISFMASQEVLNRTLGKPETMSKLEISGVKNEAVIFRWINEEPNTQAAQPIVTTE